MRASSPSTAPLGEPRARVFSWAALLVVLAVIAYSNSFGGPFLFDDKPAILENPTITHLSRLSEIFSPPKIGSSVTGRPLANATLALNYAISGTAPWSYHVFNLLLHVLAGLTAFGLVRRTLGQPVIPPRLRELALPAAFTISALWIVHPLQTESVTSIIQRTESLVSLFYLLTLYAFVRAVQSPRPGRWLTLSVVACAIGMSAKEVMVTAPLLVLCYDRTFVAGNFRGALRERRGYYAALAMTWLLLAMLVLNSGGSRGEAAGFGLGVTPWTYALTQCRAVLLYLKLAFWPHPLVLDYGTDVVRNFSTVWIHAIVLGTLVALTVWAFVRKPIVGFLGAWFFVVIAPSSSVVPLVSQTIAEHRMYLPLLGVIALIVGWAVVKFGRASLVVAAVVGVLFVGSTWQRNEIYRTELGAWTDTVNKAPQNARAQINLAESLILLGRPAEALAPATTAVALRPDYAEAQANLGIVLTQLGRPTEALPHCEAALRLEPHRPRNLSNLGGALLQLGRVDEAIDYLNDALKLGPSEAEAAALHRNLGAAYLSQGNAAAAAREFEAWVRVQTDSADAHYSLGLALGRLERYDEAIGQFELAVRLQPDHARAREALTMLRSPPGGP